MKDYLQYAVSPEFIRQEIAAGRIQLSGPQRRRASSASIKPAAEAYLAIKNPAWGDLSRIARQYGTMPATVLNVVRRMGGPTHRIIRIRQQRAA